MVNTTIANLTEGKRNVSITARVMRRWKNELTEKKGSFYIDLILIDEEGTTIEAMINKSIRKKFDEGIEEGKTYQISKFRIVQNNQSGKLTNHKCKIWFEYSTSLITVVTNKNPKQAFKFASFKDIIDDKITPSLCVDILGELISYHPMHDPPTGAKRTQIDLQDIDENELSCILWGSYVDEVTKIINEYKTGDRPILAIQFVNRTEWRDNVKVTTIRGASKIYVNPDISELVEFEKSQGSDHASQSSRLSAVSNDNEDVLSRAKLATPQEIKDTDQPGDSYATVATIIEIDSNSGWFYNACNKCKKKCMKNEDGLYYCSSNKGCPNASTGVKSVTPRYQVKFFVTGGEVVFAKIIMFDQQIGQLIDISASTLFQQMEKDGDGDSIPFEFSKFIDKEMVINLRVSREFNLQTKWSHCYTVSKFSVDKTMISKWVDSYNIKAKGKEKFVMGRSEDITNENDCGTFQESGDFDMIKNGTTDTMGSPITPSSYNVPTKRDGNEVGEVFEISPTEDKESRNKQVSKYKSRKIKGDK